jgi:probable phosphoglycerate mutase
MIQYIVRHGETVWNKKGISQGHKDSPLTRRGIRSAKKLGKKLSGENIGIIYSSDLGRCVQTAEIINRQLNVKLIKTAKLREQNFGDYNGKLNRWVRKRIDIGNHDAKSPNGESFNQMKTRILRFVYSLADQDRGKALLVTHDGPLRAILSEYYYVDSNSEKCESSSDKFYRIEIKENKIESCDEL